MVMERDIVGIRSVLAKILYILFYGEVFQYQIRV